MAKEIEFNEKARAGEDLEWRNRIKKNALFKINNINEITLSYYSLPNNILSIVYKYHTNNTIYSTLHILF